MGRLKKALPTIVIGLIFFAGVCVMLYPAFASWWNGRVQSRAVASYEKAVAVIPETGYEELYAAARAYNERLFKFGSAAVLHDPGLIEGYDDILRITGSSVMGYITIDKISVNLPIYHGTGESSLSAGAGHLKGSSFPVGGRDTHCVISAHRGLPSATMFTNLDKLETGDTFELHVLGETLAYEIESIVTVLPTETEELFIQKGRDLCTLMTCTPYGINTHRLLLRAHRIPYDEESGEQREQSTAIAAGNRIFAILATVLGAMALVLLLSQLLVKIVRKRKQI